MKLHLAPITVFLAYVGTTVALPAPTGVAFLARRQYKLGNVPFFPQEIPSCVACQPEWTGISSCARAAPAFKDWKQMLFNPVSFVDAIKCACTDTFSSAYPQCVDCFVQRNQCEEYLGVPSLEANSSSIFDGMRNVCGFGSALLGGVASSQAANNISYTYNGAPNQGYPTATSTGVGGMDYGSAEGAKSGAAGPRAGAVGGVSMALALGIAGMVLL